VDGFEVTPVEGLRTRRGHGVYRLERHRSVTTDVASHLVEAYHAERFLEVDPEEYYVFSDPANRFDWGGRHP
jgi:hypothetical protein